MVRSFNAIAYILLMLVSCNTYPENQELHLENQQIGLASVHNARQLGGYRIGDKRVKEGLLLRSARLSGLSEEDSIRLAKKYRLQRIYDFRGQEEALAAPDIIPGDATYLPLSLSFNKGETKDSVKIRKENELVLMLLENAEHPAIQAMCENIYDMIFFDESSQEVYRRFFADLITLQPEDGAVLWHCTQGKDRAGCASAMLLAALGAGHDLIMTDFTLSKEYYDPHVARIETKSEAQRTAINTLIGANPAIFEKSLKKIDARYGSLRNYLTECIGVTPEMMTVLCERYLEPLTPDQ